MKQIHETKLEKNKLYLQYFRNVEDRYLSFKELNFFKFINPIYENNNLLGIKVYPLMRLSIKNYDFTSVIQVGEKMFEKSEKYAFMVNNEKDASIEFFELTENELLFFMSELI